jgi:hypothetical protein
MPNDIADLKQRISNSSDDDLLKIVNVNFHNYRREVVDLAIRELERRGYKLLRTGADFKVITPAGIRLTPRKIVPNIEEPSLFSSYIETRDIPAHAYVLAIAAGIFMPLIIGGTISVLIAVMTNSIGWFVILPIVVIITYAALGIAFSYEYLVLGWKWGLWIAVPAFLLSLLSKILSPSKHSSDIGYDLATLLGTIIGGLLIMIAPACLGAYLGEREKKRRQLRQDVV